MDFYYLGTVKGEFFRISFLCDSEELNVKQHEEQKQQLEMMNRIASSVESFAMAAAGAVESLAKNQETLNDILVHLENK
jgi:phosphoribosyl-dephospho-CoA transferase